MPPKATEPQHSDCSAPPAAGDSASRARATTTPSMTTSANAVLSDPSVKATAAEGTSSTTVASATPPTVPRTPQSARYDFRRYPKRGTASLTKPQSGLTSQGKLETVKMSDAAAGSKPSSSLTKNSLARRERPRMPCTKYTSAMAATSGVTLTPAICSLRFPVADGASPSPAAIAIGEEVPTASISASASASVPTAGRSGRVANDRSGRRRRCEITKRDRSTRTLVVRVSPRLPADPAKAVGGGGLAADGLPRLPESVATRAAANGARAVTAAAIALTAPVISRIARDGRRRPGGKPRTRVRGVRRGRCRVRVS